MGASRLPFIRGRAEKTDYYRSPKGGGGGAIKLPPRDPAQHRTNLLGQLEALHLQTTQRKAGERDPEATRETIVVQPEPAFELSADSLGSTAADVRVLGTTESGDVLLDAHSAELPHLRKKIVEYANDAKLTPKGVRANAPAIAPIRTIKLATHDDLMGPRLRESVLPLSARRWFELGCIGGVRTAADSDRSRRQIIRQLQKLHHSAPQEFLATEAIVFFVRLSFEELRAVIAAVDCVCEFDLAPSEIRDWLLFNEQPARQIRDFTLTRPADDAPSIVLLDTGIATKHPLLANAILSSGSVVPNDNSAEDTQGHGTLMAGVALHGDDLGSAVEAGAGLAPHWIQSVRLLVAPAAGSAGEDNRPFWPKLTIDAVEHAEKSDTLRSRPRVFALATSYAVTPIEPTYWSHAIDRLAFNDGRGRLLCVAIGNADVADVGLIHGYPTLNLQQKVQEPAQAANALTVGAFTAKVAMPPEKIYAEANAVAPLGGISPHTSAGEVSRAVKPDVLMEGGNIGFDGQLADTGIETLTTLTTAREFLTKPLGLICQTSEATARGARLAALAWHAEPNLRPATVRGLIVHAASWTPVMRDQFPNLDERLAICGWGVPDLEFASACANDRATVIFEDEMPNAIRVIESMDRGGPGAGSKSTETKFKRIVKLFRFPVPEDILLAEPDRIVELRVTLSYFPEPNTFRRQVSHGLDLTWDMQGPAETEAAFISRINKLARGERPGAGAKNKKKRTKTFEWHVRTTRRSRGTVQSDRWVGPASFLAGPKMLAVVPVLGWWERRPALRELAMPFSLIVTVRADGLDIYNPIRVAVESEIEVTT
jgi:hypothetical protein